MPMPVRNTQASFPALMNAIFRNFVDAFLVIYLFDVLILAIYPKGILIMKIF